MSRCIYERDEVFGVSRDFPLNYVIRERVDSGLREAVASDKHIVLHGSSKQGKTSLRKKNLNPEDYVVITCSNKWTLAQLHASILKAAGFTVETSTTKATSGEMKLLARLSARLRGAFSSLQGEGGLSYTHSSKTEATYEALEIDPADVNDIVDCLDVAASPRIIVLEDFHYLPEETQVDFSIALKAFHEDSDYIFMVVGVWKDENRLILQNGDLGGRVVSINADEWTLDELRLAIRDGERLLQVHFDDTFVEDLVSQSFDSIYIVQECCRLACKGAGVERTQESLTEIVADAGELIQQAVTMHSARYRSFLTNFPEGHQVTTLEMHKYILGAILLSSFDKLDSGLTYNEIRKIIDMIHPEAPINQGNITQALRSTSSLQVNRLNMKPVILDFDETSRILNIVDRTFLIWLANQDPKSVLEMAGFDAGQIQKAVFG